MHQLIGGQRRPGRGAEPLAVVEPATGDVLAEIDTASLADVDDAVAAANAAAPELERLSFFERADLLWATADRLEASAAPLAEQLARESGKALAAEAVDELAESADIFRLAAEEIKRLETHVLPSVDPRKRVFTHRKPNGVYALVTPWNFPMNIPAELLAAALAAGNPAVIKPSENAPLSALALAEAVAGAGFPIGAVSVVMGRGEVGQALVSHSGVHGVGFVGSQATAAAIVAAAGMKRTIIEASGNGPQIVFDDADLEAAADAAVFGAHFVSGQCCVATERLLVHDSVHDELVDLLVDRAGSVTLGDPLDDATLMGPLNNEVVAARMDDHVAGATAQGARVLLGGRREPDRPTGLYYEMTVIDDVTPAMDVFRHESFGPVIPVTRFGSDDEAFALANDSDLGLQASAFTASLSRAYRAVDELRTGTVLINEGTAFWEQHPPFGGASRTGTGWGRIGGKYTILDMTDLRTAIIDTG
ncbi:MAG: aldehyde dehydrogenase [Acidimicrobiaceae bacterium]|nr:aldehyde dehydrogenase [Acidimicrobiaceae bacterium]MYH77495.1 aldehyde dehydrogenase [Acidimicrobiaceae bacterium]MYK77021.1 aldehyde dehydrogenase [Acidimicrobiaceae bacterium]